ncbi:ABC transporter permease subunit [Roseovarius faecimaris]|uniref:ABC transporter permease subunit n=1 Tax=Roseovarius faecimaris TaxID=2494550 RepID=A0A6I6IQF2_9RHOB|nr:ABC transporter permease subunit [Roseovarius faecimaris]QGX98915.1 ABC transporter permease subunit [Roseovarius faecimaris]
MSRPGLGPWVWLALILATVGLMMLPKGGWLVSFPEAWEIPFTPWLNAFMDWCVDVFGPAFRAFSRVMDVPMSVVRDVLNWLPWSVTLVLLTYASYALSGVRLAIFTFLSVLYMVVIGYWSESMNSLALVAISVPMAVGIGFGLGTLAFFSNRAERVLQPTMDLLQTVPAFAYLLPILLLFGFGPVVGLIASILYAFPPTVRNTMLGLRRVPQEVIEAGLMAGATGPQLFWRVRVPSAMRQILLGVNQTTMAAFSMVIIASIIGGTADIGWEVLSTMRKAQFGESLLAGIVIALMAMVMDRLTAAAAEVEPKEPVVGETFVQRYRVWLVALGLGVGTAVLAQIIPALTDYPRAWEIYPAQYLNDAVTYLVVEHSGTINAIKTLAFFFAMLPVKIGLEQTITPFSWGFEFTTTLKLAYAALALAVTAWALMSGRRQLAILLGFTGVLLFFGLTRLPWPTLLAMGTLLSWQLAGPRLAIGTFLGLGFLLLAGVWPQAMLSVYLCGLAVLLSFALGASLGILAAEYDGVSAALRPINDTLQTMPLFVILIPFVMIFKIGEFTALLAIMAYATVPAIRYTEHGLRNIPKEVLEAATAIGCTKSQLLWRVKLPLALPVMMLGLNQTIMFGIAMLVIAALVGTNGLGQQVYIGLGDGDFGVGIVAGIGMAIIAIIADRLTQAWSRKRQIELGLKAE